MMKKIFLFVLISMIASCVNKDNQGVHHLSKTAPSQTQYIQADSVQFPVLGNFFNAQIKRDMLVVFDPASENILHMVSLKDMSLICSYGRKGRGPGEFIFPIWVEYYDGNRCSLADMVKSEIYLYNFEVDTLSLSMTFELDCAESNAPKLYTAIQSYGDSMFLFKRELPDSTSLELAPVGDPCNRTIATNLNPRPKDATNYSLYDCYIAQSDQIALHAYRFMDRLEFYQKPSYAPQLIVEGERTNPDADAQGNPIRCYTDLKVYDKLFYAVLQNKDKNTVVEVWNENGENTKTYLLDRYIKLIVVDTKTNTLYGFNPYNEGSYVYTYSL